LIKGLGGLRAAGIQALVQASRSVASATLDHAGSCTVSAANTGGLKRRSSKGWLLWQASADRPDRLVRGERPLARLALG
jgi:hypothetical protein